ncbi:MAG: hypothetical protein IKK93_04800 [Campylobacter sp.]|nr:hypothetical protein [Campylobacter sp.]
MAKKVFGSEICNDINPLISYELKMQCYRAYAGSFETLRILNRQTHETAKDIEKLNELAFKLKKSQDIKESADKIWTITACSAFRVDIKFTILEYKS